MTLAAGSLSGSVASGREARALGVANFSEGVVDQSGEADGGGGRFHVRAGSGQGDHLGIDSVIDQHLLAVIDIAMAGDADVVIAGVEDARIAVGIDGDFDGAGPGAERVEIGRRIVVVVEVDDRHDGGEEEILSCKGAHGAP